MYTLVEYGRMVGFEQRTSAYARALTARISPGSVVLDIGTGLGILSFLACQAGAAKVYAVEPSDVIQVARELARDNGFSDRIEFIQALTTEIDLPEKVDGIVSDVRGQQPFFGRGLVSILDARDRFLKPGGWIIPARDSMWAALSTCPEVLADLTQLWNSSYGLNLERARQMAANNVYARHFEGQTLAVEPLQWLTVDYPTLTDANGGAGDLVWEIQRDATAHGLRVWYVCENFGQFTYSNSPSVSDRCVFHHGFLPWPEEHALKAGDRVEVSLRVDFDNSDYVWSWNTRITPSSGAPTVNYNQSTFRGVAFSPDRLRKRALDFSPEPNSKWAIDYRAMELIGRRTPLKEIADILLREFPKCFTNPNEALLRASDLAELYSK
jgi:protein arginine N-methyltransferase 1